MGTRQLRISDPDQIRKRVQEFLGKSINIVLTNGMIMTGKLDAIKNSEIILQNMRLQKMPYSFDSIAELYVDSLS
ncbi:MAG TPA: hypothetical protein VGK59_14780 [Ohtaekwangia sp.]